MPESVRTPSEQPSTPEQKKDQKRFEEAAPGAAVRIGDAGLRFVRGLNAKDRANRQKLLMERAKKQAAKEKKARAPQEAATLKRHKIT